MINSVIESKNAKVTTEKKQRKGGGREGGERGRGKKR